MNVEINPDSYGSDLRVSYLADLIEVSAYKYGTSMSEADLADTIRDNSWARLLKPRLAGATSFTEGDESGDSPDLATIGAARAFDILRQRRSQLTPNKYPFAVDARVKYTGDTEKSKAYLGLLLTSFCQGAKCVTSPEICNLFEKITVSSLVDKGLPIANIGTSLYKGNFKGRIQAVTDRFNGLVATVDEAIYSANANDAGVDFFGMFVTDNDKRHGQWIMIGQATVCRSGDWLKKIAEPKPNTWSKFFGERVSAIPFFSTPHHIPDDYLRKLAQDNPTVAIYDRLRLASELCSFSDHVPLLQETIGNLFIEGICDSR